MFFLPSLVEGKKMFLFFFALSRRRKENVFLA